MRRRNLVIVAAVSMAALGLIGCGQREQAAVQKTGRYQGKPDASPWDSPQWGGDQAKWERDIQARTQNQNEYTRTQ